MSDTYISQRAIIDIPIPTKSERKYVTYNHDDIYEQGYQEALDKAATLPPADVVEVVRCRNCQFWQDAEAGVVEVPICARPQTKGEKLPFVMEIGGKGFCSYGERRERKS